MARLQRKKTSGGKKKKKQSSETAHHSGAQGSAGSSQPTLIETPARDAKKRKVFVPKKATSGPRAEPGKIRGYWDKSLQFLREVKVELKKVTWPSRKQTMGSTVVVLILVMIISFFLGMADIALSGLIRVVLQ